MISQSLSQNNELVPVSFLWMQETETQHEVRSSIMTLVLRTLSLVWITKIISMVRIMGETSTFRLRNLVFTLPIFSSHQSCHVVSRTWTKFYTRHTLKLHGTSNNLKISHWSILLFNPEGDVSQAFRFVFGFFSLHMEEVTVAVESADL